MAKLGTKVFASERLTFRLAALAEQAINANDAIFIEIVGLTIRELRVLRIIDDNPGTTFVDISAATAMERSQTSRIIQKLIGDKLVRRFIEIDKISTAVSTQGNVPRPYRFGYGVFDENLNMHKDPGEKKVYFEFSDYSTPYVFFEHPHRG